ncbi:hypothetical protein ON010_g12692 [Phytophthora cinnamomi]|nr:hypothetical protein ON010_g12692 [Phytophthora cinnamomi]
MFQPIFVESNLLESIEGVPQFLLQTLQTLPVVSPLVTSRRIPTVEVTKKSAPAFPMSSNEDSNLSMEQVHAAWLAAGARGDVSTMRRLREQHPQWLDLQRLVGTAADVATTDSAPHTQRFCGWKGFHLSTIGASTLLTATWEGDLGIVELLLEAGQDPDTRDNGGLTPTMMALLRYNVVVMRCVFRNGQAVRRNIVVDVRWLRIGHERNEVDDLCGDVYEIADSLHYAANGDAFDVARFLLDSDADANAQDQHGKTPLHHCIHEGSLLVANLLVARGADIDMKDENGETPLTLCFKRRSMNMLQIVLNHHHMVATAQRQDFAADVLFNAVDYGVEEAVRLIVDGGYSSVTVQNAAGETPLHRAMVKRNPQLMEVLVDLDPADESLRLATTMGESSAHYAACYGTVSVMETLLRRLTVVYGDLRELEAANNPLNATNNAGVTCLYAAGTTDGGTNRPLGERDAIIDILQQHGARLFAPDCVVIPSPRSSSAELVILHEHVRRGIVAWLRDISDQSHEIDGDEDNGDEARTSDVLLTELVRARVRALAAGTAAASVGDAISAASSGTFCTSAPRACVAASTARRAVGGSVGDLTNRLSLHGLRHFVEGRTVRAAIDTNDELQDVDGQPAKRTPSSDDRGARTRLKMASWQASLHLVIPSCVRRSSPSGMGDYAPLILYRR